MKLPLYQIDTFTPVPFHGNPAVVCLLPWAAESEWMQAVAAETMAPATAFVVSHENYRAVRWFTPETELERCGHGTLAATQALRETGAISNGETIRWRSRWGRLGARISGDWIELDLPAEEPKKVVAGNALSDALGVRVNRSVVRDRGDLLVELDDEETIRRVRPNQELLATLLPQGGIIITAAADQSADYDFVSRVFAPGDGLPEDPVTGSAHCLLGPFWANRLGRSSLRAHQASQRGGTLRLRIAGDRVLLSGQATTILEGTLSVPCPPASVRRGNLRPVTPGDMHLEPKESR